MLKPTDKVSARLMSGTLKTPDDVKTWVGETETELLGMLEKGPIVIN